MRQTLKIEIKSVIIQRFPMYKKVFLGILMGRIQYSDEMCVAEETP